MRHRVGLLALLGVPRAVDREGAGRDDPPAAVDVRVRHAAAVHHLQHDPAAARVHGLGHAPPAGDLLVADDAGLADEGLPLLVGVGALGDDQPDAGPLRVVLDDEVAGDAGGARAHAGERGHDDAVGELEVAEGHGAEQVHGAFLVEKVVVRGNRTAVRHSGGRRTATGLTEDGRVSVETTLLFGLAAVAVVIVVHWLEERTGLPAAALLTVAGIVLRPAAGAERAAGPAPRAHRRPAAAALQRGAGLQPARHPPEPAHGGEPVGAAGAGHRGAGGRRLLAGRARAPRWRPGSRSVPPPPRPTRWPPSRWAGGSACRRG